MSLMNQNQRSYFMDNSGTGNDDVADFIISKGYLPNEKDLPKTSIVKNVDNDVTYILSKLSDEELIKLLNDQPKKSVYDLNDIVKVAVDSNPFKDDKISQNLLNMAQKKHRENYSDNSNYKTKYRTETDKPQEAYFRLDEKRVDPFNMRAEGDPNYAALQKLNNLLNSRPQEETGNSDEDDEKRELLFDVLVAQLKALCCKRSKSSKNRDAKKQSYKPKLNEILQQEPVFPKVYSPEVKAAQSKLDAASSEYMFLIINDEIKGNGSDELISVDPESLEKNSSVLLLGPITTPLSNIQLKTVMTRISNELAKPDYLPLLQQISDGTLSGSNIRLMKSLVTGPETRRLQGIVMKRRKLEHHSTLNDQDRIKDNLEDDTCIRCGWLTKDPLYINYHDEEWGKPERDSLRLFEMLCLEGQQAGLSWITILKKRENYRKAFFNFDPQKLSKLSNQDIKKYLNNPGIIRHKNKIEAIINNAKCVVKMHTNGEDFADFVWSFVNKRPLVNNWTNQKDIPTKTKESIALSKALIAKGFKYVGPTISYAFMQACGLVNDHIINCIVRNK